MSRETPLRIGAYPIDRLLARTGLSEVYLARAAGDERVCIKRLRPELAAADAVAALRFRKEAALLAEVDHPSIVRVHEIGTDSGVPYLCIEYVAGHTLRAHIARGPCPLLEALDILHQIAVALIQVHAKRIIHGDLKPENILLRPAPGGVQVKLVDFGLAEWADERTATFAGTLHYVAPEQTELLDWPLAEYSDLYALGVIAFELLTGHVPFDSHDPATLLAAHVSQAPPRPSSLVPDVPPLLERLVLKLLEKVPPLRYRSAASLAHDLGRLADDIRRGLPSPSFEIDAMSDPALRIGEVFIGRVDELSKLEEILAVVRRGHPSFCFVGGVAGVGKSTLVREFRNRSLTGGARFAAGKSYGFARALPYYVLGEAVRDYLHRLRQLPPEERARISARIREAVGEQGAVLAHVIPDLGELFPDGARQGLGEGKSQAQIHHLIARLLEAMAPPGQPLVLVLDDLQWADIATLRVLEFLFEGLSACSLCVLATYRTEEVDEGSLLQRLLRSSDERIHAVRLSIAPLDFDETARLVAESLHRPRSALPAELIALLHERTRGNPLFVAETLKALLDAGAVVAQDGRVVVMHERAALTSLPSSLVDMILRRVRELEAWVCDVLGTAALAGSAISIPVLAAVTGLSDEQVFEAMRQGVAERILVQTPQGGYGFYHDRVHEACSEILPANARAGVQRRILVARERLEPPDQDVDRVFELAELALLARDEARIWRYCAVAGELASSRYANEQAIGYFRHALEAGAAASPEARRGVRFELAICLQRIGEYEDATATYEQILTEPVSEEEAARCLNGMSLIAQKTGDYKRSEELSLRAASAIGLGGSFFGQIPWLERLRYGWTRLKLALLGPARATSRALLRIEILTRLCYLAVNGKQTRMLSRNSYRLLTEAIAYGDSTQLVHAYHIYATGLWELPRPRVSAAERVATKSVEVARRIGAHVETGVSMVYAGAMFLWSGRMHAALPWFENARDLLVSVGERWQLANVYIFLYRIYKGLGRLDDCVSAAHALCQLGERIQAVGTLANGYQKLADILLLRGEISIGFGYLERSETLAEKHRLNFELFQIYKTKAAHALRSGDYARARVHYQAAIELNETPGMSFYRAYLNDTYFGYAEAVLRDEEHLEASGGLRGVEGLRVARYIARGLAEERSMGGHLGHGYRARAWLLLRRGRRAASRRAFVRAMRVLAQQDRVIELAQTQLDAARALGQDYQDDALRWLQQARSVFQQRRIEAAEQACTDETMRLGHRVEELPAVDSESAAAMEELLEVSRLLMESSSLDVLFERIVDSSIKLLKADRALLFMRPAGGDLSLYLGKSADGTRLRPEDVHISYGVVERVEASGQGVAVSDTTQSEELRDRHSIIALGVRSVLCAALTHDGERLGVLYLDNRITQAIYGERELKILESMAAQAAIALASAKRFREIEELNQSLDRKVAERTRELEAANVRLASTLSELENTTLRLAEAQRAALEQEIVLARNVQSSMIPPRDVLALPAARFAGMLDSASLCGGDFWTYVDFGDRLIFFVGDVLGHGLGPAMVTAMAKSCVETLYRGQLDAPPTVEQLMQRLNDVVFHATRGEYSMTGCAVQVDRRRRTLTSCLAGHTPPLLLGADGVLPLYEKPSSPLGVPARDWVIDLQERAYRPGDRLLLYTDGLTECASVRHLPFGVGRLVRLFKRHAASEVQDTLAAIRQAVQRHTEGVEHDDDITMIVAELR